MTRQLKPPLGILGGTFDPVHLGHIHIAKSILSKSVLDHILFIPSYVPVHRRSPEANPRDRVAMIRLAIAEFPGLSLDEREIKRKEPSFMIDTLASLHQDYPDTPLALIIGSDAYLNIASWKDWQALLSYAHFVVVNRPGFEFKSHPNEWLREHETNCKENIAKQLAGHILFTDITPSTISATAIRERIKQHESIANLVPEKVAEYIAINNLYSDLTK